MLKIYSVAFFGHRTLHNINQIEALLEEQIMNLIDSKEYVEFIVGRNGDFDICVASVIKRIKKNYKSENSAICLVLPYATAEFLNNKDSFEDFYDSVEISSASHNAHPKAAFKYRNRQMVDRAQEIIFYVENDFGGAYDTLQYAKRKNKKFINIAQM